PPASARALPLTRKKQNWKWSVKQPCLTSAPCTLSRSRMGAGVRTTLSIRRRPLRFLFDLGRGRPSMVRGRRRQRPFQAVLVCAFPNFVGRFLATTDGLDNHVNEDQLRETENESAHARPSVEFRKLGRIIRNPARHAGQPQKVLRE